MYQALYRKYRPQTFDDVVGQQAVTQTLKSQLQSGKLSHAYLFTGSRGTGKTSSAKILAKAVNCENSVDGNPCNHCRSCMAIDSGSCMDVLEIDAASNNGVENVRDLRDDAIYSPSEVKMRVYIIDEVHMLSISAFNALLKIIEEPPEHLLFILATTELHKVPATILSRCQRFAFRRIGQDDIAARLQFVAYQEDIDLHEEAARILARLADGGMRDALSLLDQCASATNGELTAERVYECLGIAGLQTCGKIMQCIAQHDSASALSIINKLYADGKDLGALLDELTCLARDLLLLKTAPNEGISMLSGVVTDKEVKALTECFSTGELTRMLNILQQTMSGFTRSASRRTDAELCIINLCRPELTDDISSVIARITKLEDQIQSGVVVTSVPEKAAVQQASEPVEEKTDATKQVAVAPIKESIVQEKTEEAPIGFWTDVADAVRNELKPPMSGFFATSQNPAMRAVLQGSQLYLICVNKFTADMINKPDIIALVERKASAKLGKPVRVFVRDSEPDTPSDDQMQQLLRFGKAHKDIINIKE